MTVYHLTDNLEVRKAWACPDAEYIGMERILPRIPLSERETFRECMRLHQQYIESGLVNIPWEYQEELQRLDPYLRLRYDLQCQCYVIERVDTGIRGWVRLFRWANPDGSAKPLSILSVREMVDKLRQCDMQRVGADEYLKRKRAKAEAIQRDNDRRSTERVLEAIDRMTDKQINEFVAAEKAIAVGERINVQGQDAATMNMWYEMGRTGQIPEDLPGPDQAVNPGMRPGEYVRHGGSGQ